MRWIASLLVLILSLPAIATDPDVSLINIPGAAVDAVATVDAKTLTATSGATVTPNTADGGNAILIPDGYNALAVYLKAQPLAREMVRLQCKISSTTTPIDLYAWGHVIIQAPAGTTVAFGAQNRARNSNTVNDAAEDIVVVPYAMPDSLVDPTSTTLTVTPDKAPPHLWSMSSAHMAMPAECDVFKIEASTSTREIFIQEFGGNTLLPVRHVHIPANQTVRVQTRYRLIAFASIDGAPLTITGNAGIRGGNVSLRWEPSHTITSSATVGTVAAFKTAMADPTVNEIIMLPGTYDLQASGDRMNSTNYSAAMARSLRIRSSTGIVGDVLFKVATPGSAGMQWEVPLASGKYWILKDLAWDLQGCVTTSGGGMLHLTGPVHMVNCKVTGSIASGDTSVKWLASSTTGDFEVYVCWCDFSKSTDDLLAANSDGSGNDPIAHLIGCSIDGNGSAGNAQVITNHSGGTMAVWGCTFGNLTTGNLTRIAPDAETSPTYLMFCKSDPLQFTGASTGGVDVPGNGLLNACFMHYCDFQAFVTCDGMKSILGSTLRATYPGRPIFRAPTPNGASVVSRITGSDLYAHPTATAGSEMCIDCLSDSTGGNTLAVTGSRLTSYSQAANQYVIRLFYNGGSSATAVTMTNSLLRAKAGPTPTPLFQINSGATQHQKMLLKNVLFLSDNAGGATQSISASAANTSTITNCRFQQASSPTNYSTAFPSPSNVTFSTTAPAINSFDTPVKLGNVYAAGTTATIGSIDLYGRPWLGGSWPIGAVERTEIRSGAYLYPAVWVFPDTSAPTDTPSSIAGQPKVYASVTGLGRTPACATSGPIAVIVEDPAGSILVLQYSADDGKTWLDVPHNGGKYAIGTATSGIINNRGPMQYAFKCVLYGGVPFHVTLSGN